MANLSVIIIAYNEEDNIGECLGSVKWANKIVIVDAYSTDKTVEICRQYTDKIFQHEWTNFGRQKNLALEKASNDWILNMDADERISHALADRIKVLLKENNPDDGYYMPRKNYFLGKWLRHGGCYPDYQLRLFSKSIGKFKQKKVHEGIEGCKRVSYLREPIEHFSYRTLSDYFEKFNQYTTLSAQQKFEGGKKVTKWFPFFRLPFEFIANYIIKRGYKDRFYGLLYSVLSSFHVFVKYVKLWELHHMNKDKQAK